MESNDSREIPDRRRHQTSPASLRGLNSNKAKTPKRNILVVQDDWNAKVGPDAYQHWAGGVGKFGIGETNAKGWTLLKIARNHRLALASTRTTPLHHHHQSCPEQEPGMFLMGRFTTK